MKPDIVIPRHLVQKFGEDCTGSITHCQCAEHKHRRKVVSRIHSDLYSAISKGILPHPKTLSCCDCGKPATTYDFRDYAKLEVDAVCQGCNLRRGKGRAPTIAEFKIVDRRTLRVGPRGPLPRRYAPSRKGWLR